MTAFIFLQEGKKRSIQFQTITILGFSFYRIDIQIKKGRKRRNYKYVLEHLVKLRKQGLERCVCGNNPELAELCQKAGFRKFTPYLYYRQIADRICDAYYDETKPIVCIYADYLDKQLQTVCEKICDRHGVIALLLKQDAEQLRRILLNETGVAPLLFEPSEGRKMRIFFGKESWQAEREKEEDINLNLSALDKICKKEYNQFILEIPEVMEFPQDYRTEMIFALSERNSAILQCTKITIL